MNFYGKSLEKKHSETSLSVLNGGIGSHSQHAVIWYITLISLGFVSLVIGYILHLIPARSDLGRSLSCFNFDPHLSFRDVPWLDDAITDYHVDDKGDIWRSSRDILIQKTTLADILTLDRNTGSQFASFFFYKIFQIKII